MEHRDETYNTKPSRFKRHFTIFVVVLLLCLSFFSGVFYAEYKQSRRSQTGMLENLLVKSHNKDQPKDVDFSLFWEAWNLVNDKYVDKSKLNKTEMIYGAISGMVKSLGDPFSGFMDPEANQQFLWIWKELLPAWELRLE